MELIFHKSKKYIDEDIFYYISDQRDKHSMIKPKKENLISMTVDSELLITPTKNKVSNIFYPFKKNSIDKIYLGLSFPLFSNNWAASYLRYLLKIIKKDGSIILPVYPEEQAEEKGLFSRSFLENIFTSRTGWTGTNNVWAENDGVMSMRIGKKFPKKMNSTCNYFLEEMGNAFYRDQENKNNLQDIKNFWATSRISAIVEKIIQDNGNSKKLKYCDIGDDPFLPFEVNASNYIKVNKTLVITDNEESYADLENYFSYRNKNNIQKIKMEQLLSLKPNVLSIINNKNNIKILEECIKILPESTFIIFGEINNNLYENFVITPYSSIMATSLKTDKIINHYSDIIQDEINEEKNSISSKFYVLKPKI